MKRNAVPGYPYCLSIDCNLRKKCMRHHSHYTFLEDVKYEYFNGSKKKNEECTEYDEKGSGR